MEEFLEQTPLIANVQNPKRMDGWPDSTVQDFVVSTIKKRKNMKTKSQTDKAIETTQEPVTISPDRSNMRVIKITNLLNPKRYNKCDNCRISKLCIPAKIDEDKLKTLDQLHFISRTLNPGEILCHQGQLQDNLYALRSGILKSYVTQSDGREFVMGFHLPPDIFGWEGIDPEHLTTNIVALEHSNVCEIPLKRWEKLVSQIPELGTQILRLVSQKIRFENNKMLKTTAEQRVANFLLQLSAFYQRLDYPDYLCKLPMTHQDIANYLRIAPETISRTFRQLHKKEAIRLSKTSKRKLYIKDFEKLKAIANS